MRINNFQAFWQIFRAQKSQKFSFAIEIKFQENFQIFDDMATLKCKKKCDAIFVLILEKIENL